MSLKSPRSPKTPELIKEKLYCATPTTRVTTTATKRSVPTRPTTGTAIATTTATTGTTTGAAVATTTTTPTETSSSHLYNRVCP